MGGAGSARGGAVTGGRGGAAGANSALIKSQTTAIAANTKAVIANNIATNSLINILRPTLPVLSSSLSPLTQSIANLITAMNNLGGRLGASGIAFGGRGGRRGGARPPRGFARGGLVPGSGNRDTVPAMLTPGEFVIRKSATQAFGAGNLAGINKYAEGTPKGRGVPAGKKKDDDGAPRRATVTMSDDLGAVFLNAGNSTFNYDKVLTKGPAFNNAVKNISGLQDFEPNVDRIETKFTARNSDHTLDERANQQFKTALKDAVSGTIKDVAKGLVNEFDVPEILATDAATSSSRALDTIDFNSLSGHIFEGVTAAATGATLTDSQAIFDFAGINKEVVDRINKLFTPDVPSTASILEAKNTATADATNKTSSDSSIFNKILRSAGAGNPLGVIAKFASGGMASGTDTVPALLTPGEFVVNKKSAQSFGYGNLKDINKYAAGGIVRPGKNNYGTPSASNVRVAGGGGGATVNTANINKNLNSTSKSVNDMGNTSTNAAGAITRLADTALLASFAIPGLIASFDQFDGTVGGTASGLLNMAVNIALLFPALKGMGKGIAAFTKTSTRSMKRFRGGARGLTGSARTAPGRVGGAFSRGGIKGAAGQLGGEARAAFNASKAGKATKAGIDTAKGAAQQIQKTATRVGIKGGGKAGGKIVKSIFKGVGKASAGLPGIIAALLVDPLVDGVENFVFGAKEQLTEGVSGRRGGTETGQGAIAATSGALKGAATGAAIGQMAIPIPVVGAVVGAIGGAIIGGIDGFFSGAAQQVEFDAFDKLITSVKRATGSLDVLANAQKLGSGIVSNALNDTGDVFANLDSAFDASLEAAGAGLDFGAIAGGVIGGAAAGIASGGNPFAIAGGAALGAGFGASEVDFEDQAEALDKALSVISEEFTAAVQAANQNLLSLSFDEALNLDSDALSVFEGAGLSMEQMADGSKRFSGENETFIAALQASGDETGRASALITSYNQAVRASALQLVKSEREAAAERVKLAEEAGGDGFFFDSDEFKDAKAAQKETAQLGLAIQNLGDSIGTADPAEIEEAIRAVGGVSGEAAAKIKQQIMEQQALMQEETRRMAAEKALAAAMAETQREIEALGEGLKKLDAITAGGVARFNTFASNFEADFDRAFGTDAKLTVPANFNPFENIDASSADEIADGLERIKGAIGDTAGGPNEGATAGFKELLKSTQDLPLATKTALEDLDREAGPQGATFASPDAAVSAVLGKLDASGAGPTGAARDLLASNLRKAFVTRQGEGGTVGLEQDLIEGVIDQVNTAGEQLKTTLANVTNSLNEFRAAQLRVAQISIEIAKKQQQAALKTLDIQQRADDMLGLNKGRDPRAVAQGNLSARLGAIQTNVNSAGVAGVQKEFGATGLLDNLSALEGAVAPLREAVESGSATDAEIAQLAAVEQALSETKQALDTLADDTTRLAAIQDRLAEIEKRKMSAQDRLFTVQAELAKAMEEGDMERVAELQQEIEAPRRALAKAQAGEALTLQESTALQQGIPQLVTEGLLTDEQAAKLRDQIAGGLVGNADFMSFMGGSGNINGRPAAEFLAQEESLGGGAMVTGVTAEEAALQGEGLAIAQEQQAIVAERTRIAEESLAKRREQMIAEMVKAEASFEAAGAALKKLRGEANLLVTQTGGAGGAPVVPDGAGDAGNLALLSEGVGGGEVAALSAEISSLKNQLAAGMNVNLNGNQNVNITDAATAGKVFEQAAELTTAAAFANKVPQLEQQFTNSVSSQMNTLG